MYHFVAQIAGRKGVNITILSCAVANLNVNENHHLRNE